MNEKYDLAVEPWIPVRMRTGQARRVGLRECLEQSHEIVGLSLPVPPAEAMLLRVLVALAYRVSALDDAAMSAPAWNTARSEVLAAGKFDDPRVERYFQRHANRFDLFDGERPFWQDPRLARECHTTDGGAASISAAKFMRGRAGGNEVPWFTDFDEVTAASVRPDEAAWHLLIHHGYGDGGITSCPRQPEGGAWGKSMRYGPLRGSVSYFPSAGSLFESLLMAMVPPIAYGATSGEAPWESDSLPDPLDCAPRPRGIVETLVGRSVHAALLIPDDRGHVTSAYLTWAYAGKPTKTSWTAQTSADATAPTPTPTPTPQEDHPIGYVPTVQAPVAEATRDPFLSYGIAKPEVFRKARADRLAWRDLDVLLPVARSGTERRWDPPAFVLSLAGLQGSAEASISAYSYEQELAKTGDHGWSCSQTPPILRYVAAQDRPFLDLIQQVVATADQTSTALTRALIGARMAAMRISDPKDPDRHVWSNAGLPQYWDKAAGSFTSEFDEMTDPATGLAHAAKAFARDARGTFDSVTALSMSPGRIAGVVRHRIRLLSALRSLAPRTDHLDPTAPFRKDS